MASQFLLPITTWSIMVEYTRAIHDAMKEVERLRGHKTINGTKLHYAEKRLAALLAMGEKKIERKKLSPEARVRKNTQSAYSSTYTRNRAYVLSGEIYDLTQAMVALERLR